MVGGKLAGQRTGRLEHNCKLEGVINVKENAILQHL